MPPLDIQIGKELAGRYVVSERLGSGGYGLVWKATDKTLGRTVALKRLFNSGLPDNDALIAEARKSAALIHQNIVQVYDIPMIDGEAVLVMECVDGPMLWTLLRESAKRGDSVKLERFTSIMRGLLDGISFAHGRSLFHRDLTPMNILVSSRGIPKIADFGIAQTLRKESTPRSTSHGGTGHRDFMAPEQAKGNIGDLSSDLFMVGIIGYLLLTGRHPFAHPSGVFSIEELIVDPEYLPPRPQAPQHLSTSEQRLFREYAAVVERLLQRERAARFNSAVEAISFFEAVEPGVDCPACGETVPEKQKFCGNCGKRITTPGEVAHVTTVRQTEPRSASEAVDRGFECSRRQEWHEAVRLYQLAIALDSTYQKAYANLGYALNHLGQYEEAVQILSRGLELPNSNQDHLSNFYYARSFARERLKRFEDAFEDIEKAIEGQPTSVRNRFQRAKLHLALGRYKEAADDAAAVLKERSDSVGAQSVLDEARAKQARSEEEE